MMGIDHHFVRQKLKNASIIYTIYIESAVSIIIGFSIRRHLIELTMMHHLYFSYRKTAKIN